ncbi:SLOG family protein [Sporosarcina sp. ITBMC105]
MIKRLVITGYKAHELGIFNDKHEGIAIIKKALESRMIPLLESGLEWVIISGQPGVETWAAETVIDLQDDFPELQLAVITPFEEQEKNWNDAKKQAYEFILAHADYTVSLTKRPYEAPWQFIERDKFLLRNSDAILIVYDEENDGSPKFMKKMAVSYAEKSDYEVLTIAADDLQLIAEDMQRQDWE